MYTCTCMHRRLPHGAVLFANVYSDTLLCCRPSLGAIPWAATGMQQPPAHQIEIFTAIVPGLSRISMYRCHVLPGRQ